MHIYIYIYIYMYIHVLYTMIIIVILIIEPCIFVLNLTSRRACQGPKLPSTSYETEIQLVINIISTNHYLQHLIQNGHTVF